MNNNRLSNEMPTENDEDLVTSPAGKVCDKEKEEKDEIQNRRSTIQMIKKNFSANKETADAAPVLSVLNVHSLTFYDSVLENAFLITMFVRRGHDTKFAIAMIFVIHILFASFYGQVKENMISTMIAWSISAALFVACLIIKAPDYILESLKEIEEENLRTNDEYELAVVVSDTNDVKYKDEENGSENISISVSHSLLYALILFNYFVYFFVVRIYFNGVTFSQLAIIFLFLLQLVRTFGYLRFVHFMVLCIFSLFTFIVLRISTNFVEIDDDHLGFNSDTILCFLVLGVSACLTGKYLYHYEYDERALFHSFATVDDISEEVDNAMDSNVSQRTKIREVVNRGLAGLVLEDVEREILDHHFDENFDHNLDRIVSRHASAGPSRIHSAHHSIYHSLNVSGLFNNPIFSTGTFYSNVGHARDMSKIPVLSRKHTHATLPTSTISLHARESTVENMLRGFLKGLSHGARIKRPPPLERRQTTGITQHMGMDVAAFYNLGQAGIDHPHSPLSIKVIDEDMEITDQQIIAAEKIMSEFDDDNDMNTPALFKKQHQTVNQRLGKEEKDENDENVIIEENIEPDLYSLYDLPEWYSPYEFVLNGYRLGYSFKEHATKVGLCNWRQNEWCNTMTSIVPAMLFLAIWIFYIIQFPNFFINQPLSSKIVVFLPMNYGLVSSAASTFAHNFHTVSEKYVRRIWNVDFCGIIYLCVGMSVMQIHCMFYCQQEMQIMFIFMVFLLTVVSFITSMKTLDDSIRESILGLLFVMAFVLMPIGHWIQLAIGDTTSPAIYSVGMGLCIFFLIAMITSKTLGFPEKYFVKKYLKKNHGVNILETLMTDEEYFAMMREASEEMKDHWSFFYFNSHSIWHIFGFFSMMSMFVAGAEYLKYRGSREC